MADIKSFAALFGDSSSEPEEAADAVIVSDENTCRDCGDPVPNDPSSLVEHSKETGCKAF